jgi:hypothetical protein
VKIDSVEVVEVKGSRQSWEDDVLFLPKRLRNGLRNLIMKEL